MAMVGVFVALVVAVLTPILAAFGVANLIGLLRGYIELRRLLAGVSDTFATLLLKSPLVPGVSVLFVPEDHSPPARARLRRLLDLHYGKHEVVLVADAAAMQPWIEDFRLVERDPGRYVSTDPVKLAVIAMPKSAEAARLNAAMKVAQYPVLAFVDPAAEFIPELLLHLIRPMLEAPDGVFAVIGMAPQPAAPGIAGAIGALEADRLWLVRCAAFTASHSLLPVPGCSFLIRRDLALEAGGVERIPADLFPRMQGHGRAAFVPRAVSWLPAPQSWQELRSGIQRDQRDLAFLLQHFGWGLGREGRMLFAIRMLRPLIETVALVFAAIALALGWMEWPIAGILLFSTAVLGMLTSLTALVLREFADPSIGEPARLVALFVAAVVENLGYRQIRNLWLIKAWLTS